MHIILTDTTDKEVHENKTWSNLKEKNNVLNKTYEDSSDSSNDNISDNCDSNEDFPSEQADDQNIQNHQLNLEHMLMTTKLLIKLH